MRIAIQGAGVAGPALAYWLERTGHELVLIEKAPHFRTGGYVIDFWGLGYTLAERMGILPEVRAAGYSVEEVRIVDEHGRKAGGFAVEVFHELVNNRFTSLPRGDLAAAIYRTIEGRVETIFGDSVAAVEEGPHSLRLAFHHAAPREVDLLIGADGLHSGVRELVFGPQERFEKALGYHIAVFEAEGYRPRDELVYMAYSLPGRQVSRFSLRGDRTMFLFIFIDEHLRGPEPVGIEDRKAALRRVFASAGWECPQILDAMDTARDFYFDRVSQIKIDCWSQGRTALLGDAAACVSLLAGEGSGLALVEAYVLAGELNRARGDYSAAFRRYEDQLRSFIEGKQASARDFAGAFAPKSQAGIWIRNQVTRLLAIPFLARFFLGHSLADDFELPSYE